MNNHHSLLMCALLGMLFALACRPAPKGQPSPAPRPNILFAIADDASFAHFGAYGCQWVRTPAFDRVAREGLLFMRAYTPNAKCAPSRACILTGRNSWQLEEAANHWPYFPPKFKTYAEVLAQNGYHVGYTAKGWAPGIARDEQGQPRDLLVKAYNEHKLQPPADFISTNDYTANFRAFLEARPQGQPFCFWYGSTEPHRAYEYGAGIRKAGKLLSQLDSLPPYWPDNDSVRTDLLDYAYEIEYFDQHLGQMLQLLQDAGELDNTLVVVTADNGMPFPRIKGQAYEMANHLPLAMRWPQGLAQPGRSVEAFVSFIDFAPTFLELAGVDPRQSGMQPITGLSLTDILYQQPHTDRPDYVLIGKERHDIGRPHDQGYPIRGIVKGEFLYLHNFEPDRWPAGNPETGYLNCDGSPTKTAVLQRRYHPAEQHYWQACFGKRPPEELYRISTDPHCTHNLAANLAYTETLQTLKSQLFAQLTAQQDPRMLGQGQLFDAYPYADQRQRGFYERYLAGEPLRAGWVNETDFQPE